MWTPLAGWIVVGIAVPLLVGVGVGVLSMTPPEYLVAKAAFSLGAVILAARIGWWVAFETGDYSTADRMVFSGVVFGAIGAAWLGAIMWVQQREPAAPEQVTRSAPLVIECQPWLGKPLEASMIILPMAQETPGIAIEHTEHFHVGSGSQMDSYKAMHFASINRWQITNYGPAPVLKVSLTLTLNFRKANVGQGSDTAPIIMSREWPVNINKIDPGSGSAFIFYAANRSPHLLQIIPSESATLEVLGETQRRTVSVRRLERTFYDLAPGIRSTTTSAPVPPAAPDAPK
jgi:hypothetical protein